MIIKFFDESWYLATYPDVANAGIDALTHYKKIRNKRRASTLRPSSIK
jgi:hypothetical protein